MSDLTEDYRKIIEDRITNNGFNPKVTYEDEDNIVSYHVDLPVEQRDRYLNGYYDADKTWVRDNDAEYGLCAGLYCKWQI